MQRGICVFFHTRPPIGILGLTSAQDWVQIGVSKSICLHLGSWTKLSIYNNNNNNNNNKRTLLLFYYGFSYATHANLEDLVFKFRYKYKNCQTWILCIKFVFPLLGFNGKTAFERARIDMIADSLEDIFGAIKPTYKETDQEKKVSFSQLNIELVNHCSLCIILYC